MINKRKPKIIAFINAYSQGKSGGDMVFIEVAKRIKEFDKVVVTSLLGKKLCQKSGLKAKFLITSREPEFRNIISTYFKRILRAFFLELKVEKKDVLLGTSDFLPDVLPIFWLKTRNKKVKWIQHVFHLIPSSRKIPFLSQKISFFFIRYWADLVVVDNSLLKKNLVRLGFNSQRIMINYPGINLDYLRSIKTKISTEYDGIFMGRLHRSKGIFDLVKIWKLICKEIPKAKLGIIGKGEERVIGELKREIQRAGLEEKINLLGYLKDDEAFKTIKTSRVFVFPSYEEGFGIAPLEAQALGLPVVAWNLPAFDEVFPRGMIKVEMDKIEKFAEEVVKLLVNKNLYNRLSHEAIDNARRYNWDVIASRELELIGEIIER